MKNLKDSIHHKNKSNPTIGLYNFVFPDKREYWGQSQNCESRIKNHIRFCKYFLEGKSKRQPKLYNAIGKFGWESVQINIIPYPDIPKDLLNKLEIFYISISNSYENGYNGSRGGKGGGKGCHSNKKKHSAETKIKMSEAKKGKKRKPFSEETKRKISEAQKNRTQCSCIKCKK
jgi:group I intron endonuclease